MDPLSKLFWLQLCATPSLGACRLAKLATAFDSFGAFSEAKLADLATSLPAAQRRVVLSCLHNPSKSRHPQIEEWLRWAERPDNQLYTLPDPAYPAMLRLLPDPPPMLFARGLSELLRQPQLAIVGSRNPTATGREHAYHFAKALAANGFTITSGLALGIDGAAHEGSLEQLGSTIAVLGSGLNKIYPVRHQSLADRIAKSGVLVSELPLNAPPKAANFPKRNRIISGLTLGTLVVEASIRSGSLITARLALEQGREVFAIPGSIQNPQARGCHQLIKQGAKLAETTEDIFCELPQLMKVYQQRQLSSAGMFRTEWVAEQLTRDVHISQPPEPNQAAPDFSADPEKQSMLKDAEDNRPEQQAGTGPLNPQAHRVLDAVGFEATHTDHIVERTGMQVREVQTQLMYLEINGFVRAERGGFVKTC